MKNNDFVELGHATKAHGIKGGLVFNLFNPNESILKKGMKIRIEKNDLSKTIEELKILSIQNGNKTICYLEGIIDRTSAENYLPFTIFLSRDSFPKIESDEVYIRDLIGLDVYSKEDVHLGIVESAYDNTAQIVLSLNLSGEFIELPFVENFFPKLDLENKKIYLTHPEYL